jgi:hypothetical protein
LAVSYGCETWSHSREENKLRVLQNRELRREEVTGGQIKLHNEELHTLYFSLT